MNPDIGLTGDEVVAALLNGAALNLEMEKGRERGAVWVAFVLYDQNGKRRARREDVNALIRRGVLVERGEDENGQWPIALAPKTRAKLMPQFA